MTDKQRRTYGARVRLGWFMEAKRSGGVRKACRTLGVPKSTYYYWYKKWEMGGRRLESLMDEDKTPKSHANDPDEERISMVIQLRIGMMYGEDNIAEILKRDYDINISVHGVHNILTRAGFLEVRKKKARKNFKVNDYPYTPGEVMQLDVKRWKRGGYQYDIIDCCTRIKFKYIFEDYNVNTTVKFLEMALQFYAPAFKIQLIQMDNGAEFTNENRYSPKQRVENRMSLPDQWLLTRNIAFKHIAPRSPHLNDRVERPHGVDKWRYNKMTTGSHKLKELKDFAIEDCLDYNTYRPHSALGKKTLLEFLQSLIGYENTTIDFSVLCV